MKNRQCCETHFLICNSPMLKLRAEVLLLLPPQKKLPRARLLTNRLLRNLPRRRVEKGSRARSLRRATERNRAADYRPVAVRAFSGRHSYYKGGSSGSDN